MLTYKFSNQDNAKLNLLAELASYNIDELLSDLSIDCRKSGKMYVGSCPIHSGDKQNAWTFYPDGHTVRGIWKCRTRQCETVFQRTIPGLVRGILSKENGWELGSNKFVSMQKVIDYLCNFVGQEWKSLKPDLVLQEKKKFINDITSLGLVVQIKKDGWNLKDIRAKLKIPSEYLIKRGFNSIVLDQYSAGESNSIDPNNPMFKRTVIPIMDKDGRVVVGATGRSILDQCEKCKVWHEGICPDLQYRSSARYAKWRHTENFDAENHLFNIWNAKEFVKKTESVVIVEGPLDCFKLVEAGIKNCVALFGVNLSDSQSIYLESSGAHTISLLLDKDKAGEQGIFNIKQALGRSFKIKIPELNKKDPGEMSSQEIHEVLKCN